MIRTRAAGQPYQTMVSNERQELLADAPIEKGGRSSGFGAHELLEAALAVCINMSARMYADKHSIPLESVSASVTLVRPDAQTVRFEYALELIGPLSADQRVQLEEAVKRCPVRQTLSKRLEFRPNEHREYRNAAANQDAPA